MAREIILIVDDEAPIRAALKTAFGREGIETEEASDGSDALKMLQKKELQSGDSGRHDGRHRGI